MFNVKLRTITYQVKVNQVKVKLKPIFGEKNVGDENENYR